MKEKFYSYILLIPYFISLQNKKYSISVTTKFGSLKAFNIFQNMLRGTGGKKDKIRILCQMY
jgi:hypothetical protein